MFSSYIHAVESHHQSEYIYQNASEGREEVLFLPFYLDGKELSGFVPEIRVLGPAESAVFDAASELKKIDISRFQGSIFCLVHPLDITTEDLSQKDFVSIWSSSKTNTACHIGLGALKALNVAGRKEQQRYLMYCPAVVSTREKKTLIAFFNHSSDPDYADAVTIRPRLHNLYGKSIEGREIAVAPYGTCLIDVDEIFGEQGKSLLSETNDRGCVVVYHQGHTFPTLFFHVHRATGDILIGTHTNPSAGIVFNYAIVHYWYNFFASKIPGLYVFWLVKRLVSRVMLRLRG